MGRTIDITQPLSPEDRAWLEERGKFGDLRVADEIAAAARESEPEAQDDDDEVVEGSDYGTWTKAQLQYELSQRPGNLPTSGTKAELVARLEEDDASE